ncbi:methyltransferase [uncultured Psychrosphaera sp.]|uniref:tRNA1(Val) (adenine(37)-N6)-methyltransferase n=1 Tax=uncultured Psychrosphaera sp. TaxID=1403522 RepID=UPI002603E2A8|nr:methyltransferase [uncultured Psychrosphaera sp.]
MISSTPADFCFKQFSIWHQQCAMKVNTDGILLGAWAGVDNTKNILDIGTGTGLIALMLAQRTESLASAFKHSSNNQPTNISALEIDESAYQQAIFNVKQSPWAERIQVIHHDFLSWQQEQKIEPESFDLIVSNPPYFEDSLLSDSQNKNLARHTKHMSFEQLLIAVDNLLTQGGEFNLVLPPEQASKVITLAENMGFTLTKQLLVKTTPKKPISRVLFCLKKEQLPKTDETLTTSTLTIRDQEQNYTPEYIDLCKAFYLKM